MSGVDKWEGPRAVRSGEAYCYSKQIRTAIKEPLARTDSPYDRIYSQRRVVILEEQPDGSSRSRGRRAGQRRYLAVELID